MSWPRRAFIGLGANLGDREAAFARALAALRATPGVGQVECSPLYETEPHGPPQPAYLNAAVSLTTTLAPRALLDRLLAIEKSLGRERGPERNAPRPLDLDLLFYDSERVAEPGLEVPHPRLHERAFVLTPLCDLAPGFTHPTLGRTLEELLAEAPGRDGVRTHHPED
ncbi:MAG: 2-amino-4-hydroxy-6-hydroxymethyldihydropteridine diphosphokinase [Myxococcota bacterium]|nr:2-amino-4-hydroxy-6-hydroxymethyldihydropteridine diphosphokinase [Myxococcota bacterium]